MKRYIFDVKYFDSAARQPVGRRVAITAINHKIAWEMVINYMDHFLSGNINYLDEIGLTTIEEC